MTSNHDTTACHERSAAYIVVLQDKCPPLNACCCVMKVHSLSLRQEVVVVRSTNFFYRYIRWQLSDLKTPRQGIVDLQLFGEAMDTWCDNAECKPGAIVAILNPQVLAPIVAILNPQVLAPMAKRFRLNN